MDNYSWLVHKTCCIKHKFLVRGRNIAKCVEKQIPKRWNQHKSQQSPKEKQFKIISGDISLHQTDVIVTSTSAQEFASCHGSTISRALFKRAGKSLQEACQAANRPNLRTGNVVSTPGFALNCKTVYHVILQNYKSKESETELECTIKLCLRMADNAGYSSIAFPLLGSGGFGFPLDVVFRIFSDVVESFKGNHLLEIEVVVLSDDHNIWQMADVICSEWQVICSSSSNTKKKVTEAAKVEKNVLKERFTEIIEDEEMMNLTPDEEQELQNFMKSKNVSIEKFSSTELKIESIKPTESSSLLKTKQIINEFKQVLRILDYVEWWYLHPRDEKMRKFSFRASFALENAYKKNKQGNLQVTVRDNLYLTVDFSKMEASAGVTICKVDRRLVSENPEYWIDMADTILLKIAVSNNSPEFQSVVQKFKKTLDVNVVSLHRIQNITQWNQFQEQKKKIMKKMPNQTVTRELFHGTDAATSEKILKDIFDRSYAKNGNFGKGVYFATTARYSNEYAREDSQGKRCMFLADVITGTYCQGKSDINAVPIQRDGTPYDSVVDDVKNPQKFVVFRDSSVYPSYLLTYKTQPFQTCRRFM